MIFYLFIFYSESVCETPNNETKHKSNRFFKTNMVCRYLCLTTRCLQRVTGVRPYSLFPFEMKSSSNQLHVSIPHIKCLWFDLLCTQHNLTNIITSHILQHMCTLLSRDSDLIQYGWSPCSSVITRCSAAVENYTAGQEALQGPVICASALECLPDAHKP